MRNMVLAGLALLLFGVNVFAQQRTLSLENIDKKDRRYAIAVAGFVLNSLSSERKIVRPTANHDRSQISFDLENYGISASRWDQMVKDHPYGKTVRLDWFVVNAFASPHYYRLLGIVNVADFNRLTKMEKCREESRAISTDSSYVSHSDRMVRRLVTPNGYAYIASDGTSMAMELLDVRNDDEEVLASLPNGLQVYSARKHGVLEDRVDPKIAVFKQGLVSVAASCVSCHKEGVAPLNDWVRGNLDSLRVSSTNPEALDKIRSYYCTDLERDIRRDQERYAASIRLATGLKPTQVHRFYNEMVDRYIAAVTAKAAAREVGMTLWQLREKIRKHPAPTPYLLMLFQGKHIPRYQWEDSIQFLR